MTVMDTRVVEVSEHQAADLFDRRCRAELGVSAVEFLLALDKRRLPKEWPAAAVARLEMLLPFIR